VRVALQGGDPLGRGPFRRTRSRSLNYRDSQRRLGPKLHRQHRRVPAGGPRTVRRSHPRRSSSDQRKPLQMRRTQRQIEGKQAAVYVGLDLTRSPNLDELPSPPMIADEDTIAQNKGTALKGGRTQHRTLANAKTSRRREGRARADSPSSAAATALTAESRAKFGRVRLRAGPIRPGRASGDAAGQALSSETKCTLRNFGWNVPGRLRDGRWLEES
jgi:hypothetical protein